MSHDERSFNTLVAIAVETLGRRGQKGCQFISELPTNTAGSLHYTGETLLPAIPATQATSRHEYIASTSLSRGRQEAEGRKNDTTHGSWRDSIVVVFFVSLAARLQCPAASAWPQLTHNRVGVSENRGGDES